MHLEFFEISTKLLTRVYARKTIVDVPKKSCNCVLVLARKKLRNLVQNPSSAPHLGKKKYLETLTERRDTR